MNCKRQKAILQIARILTVVSTSTAINYLNSLHATALAAIESEESCSIQWSSPYLAGEFLRLPDPVRDGVPSPLSQVVSIGHMGKTDYRISYRLLSYVWR